MRANSVPPLGAPLADRYRFERQLGQGGMATVYLAEDLRHGRKVAIKILRPELAVAIGAERFMREIRTIAALQHPHILGLIDSDEVSGQAFYVMPFVEGGSLRDRLLREKQLPITDAVRIVAEVATALDYAHRRGVIHRDIKPENILLHEGQALVADFGIALGSASTSETRITETGISLGTPQYMSPEQAMGQRDITARSDVYSLGCVAYEMLLGEPPFTGPTTQAIVAKILTERPASIVSRRSTVPVAIENAIQTALQKLPADRFPSSIAFSTALAGTGAEPMTRTEMAVRTVAGGEYRLSEDVCRRMDRKSFDPRLIGSAMHYLDNGVPADVLVCYFPACGRGADQYHRVLETASYRAIAVTPRGFEPATTWRPVLSLDDHIILVREFLRDLAARIQPRFTAIAGFSSGGDFAVRLAAAPDPESRLRIDGCLSLGANLSLETCFLTRMLGMLEGDDDAAMLATLRRVTDAAQSLDEWVNICDYVVRIVPTFRHDVSPLRTFGAAIAAPFEKDTLTPFADWYRAAAEKGCHLRCVFEDTAMFRGLVRELQLRNLDEALLGPRYEPETIVTEAGTNHFDLLDPARVEAHVQALVRRMMSSAA
jgi:tRNA A-37 threonylcarbamoyl transferase component Bud32